MKIKVLLCVRDQDEASLAAPLDKHYEYFNIFNGIIKTFSDISKILRKIQPMVIVMSKNYTDDHIFKLLPYSYRKRWLRVDDVKDIKDWGVVNCYINSALNNKKDPVMISVISSTYHSGDKIFRPLTSLQNQTYRNWEWIIWDDSQPEHKECWENLLKFQADDIRIRCYRDCDNSGFIGEMKHRASSMAKGDWIVELDHDDNIHPMLFEWMVKAIEENPEVDFISGDCIKFDEDKKISTTYGDMYANGYGSNIKIWYNNRWEIVIKTPDMTPENIRHIISVPNHPRVWKRSFYEDIGRHNSLLPVVDDYQLLIRSFLEGNWLNISYPCYTQFDNSGGNNFTYLRNSLIQHLVRQVRTYYEPEIHNRIVSLGLKDYSMGGNYVRGKAWQLHYKDFNHKKFIKCFEPLIDRKTTIAIVLTVNGSGMNEIWSYLNQSDKDTMLFVVGNKSIDLDTTMKFFSKFLPQESLMKIRWWNLINSVDNLTLARNYATRMMNSCPIITYFDENETLDVDHIKNLRQSLGDKIYHVTESKHLINKIELFQTHGDFYSDHQEYLERIEREPEGDRVNECLVKKSVNKVLVKEVDVKKVITRDVRINDRVSEIIDD